MLVLAAQKKQTPLNTVSTADKNPDKLIRLEWLVTNNRGGYASSSIISCNTRRYHGLLVGSATPPANRITGLSNCLDTVIFEKENPQNGRSKDVHNLATFEFNGKFAPEGFKYLKYFRRDTGAHFQFQIGQIDIAKSIYLLPDDDVAALVYDFSGIDKYLRKQSKREKISLVIRPLVGLRDFHTLQKSYARMVADRIDGGLSVRHNIPGSCELFLSSPSMDFSTDPQWWFNFIYRKDRERGQEFTEDLWSPGFFKTQVHGDSRIILWAQMNSGPNGASYRSKDDIRNNRRPVQYDIHKLIEVLKTTQRSLYRRAKNVKRELEDSILREHGAKRSFAGRLSFSGKNRNGALPKSGISSTLADLLPEGSHRNTVLESKASYKTLILAADQFITRYPVKKGTNNSKEEKYRTTILAGYPWFADWGRDTFISLPGLLLLTGRFEEAACVLSTFAAAVDEGMIPNRFDNYNRTAYFNSIDSSLWFISASFQYLRATDDTRTFTQNLLPAIRWIIDSYKKGTRFDIHADSDGLITGGREQTQLTWMDAKFDGIAFTPRFGKAVEVNALWYKNLCSLARFYEDRDLSLTKEFKTTAEKVKESFVASFWNRHKGYLNDCIRPDGRADDRLRPNQIFAVSLARDLLNAYQAKCVVEVVQNHLLTPYGLRTLPVEDGNYKPEYKGPQSRRDEAYHQGTVWPYLMGPFIEAYLKVGGFNRKNRKKASEFIQPLLGHLTEDGCLGQISEIFDGDPPHRPKGCFAQAWSVAEIIRAYNLIYH